MTPIKFKRLHPDAKLPTYAKPGDAGFDIHALHAGLVKPCAGLPLIVQTGWAVAIPDGHAMLLVTRSGHRRDFGLHAVGVGVGDSGYRGEMLILLTASRAFQFEAGDRIAQGLIVPAPQYPIEWADELSETERGSGGFGSTGT